NVISIFSKRVRTRELIVYITLQNVEVQPNQIIAFLVVFMPLRTLALNKPKSDNSSISHIHSLLKF
ncbi:hypothetical protein, partial [Acinetobacter baumannii]|uniref:hypothetical protein n=1 Tax=Acinetobacter baumannii TaxID=470 RepID=UPI003FA5E778